MALEESVLLILTARDQTQTTMRQFARNLVGAENATKNLAKAEQALARQSAQLDAANNALGLRTSALANAKLRAADASKAVANATNAELNQHARAKASLQAITDTQTALTNAKVKATAASRDFTTAQAAESAASSRASSVTARATADIQAASAARLKVAQALSVAQARYDLAEAQRQSHLSAVAAAVSSGAAAPSAAGVPSSRSVGTFRANRDAAQAAFDRADAQVARLSASATLDIAAANKAAAKATDDLRIAQRAQTAAQAEVTAATDALALARKGDTAAALALAKAQETLSRANTQVAVTNRQVAASTEEQRLAQLRAVQADRDKVAAESALAGAARGGGIGARLAAVGPAAVAGGVLAAGFTAYQASQISRDIQTQIAQVASATGADVTGLRGGLSRYEQTGQAPYDTATLVQGTYLPYSEGMTTKQVTALTPTLAQTSAILGQKDEGDVSKAILTLANVYAQGAQTSNAGFTKFADMLVGVERTVRLPAGDIARALPRSVGVAATTGVKAEDYLAYISKQSYSGQTAIQANNNLSATLTALLLKPTVQTQTLAQVANIPIQGAGVDFVKKNGLQAYLQLIKDRFAGDEQDLARFLGQRNALRGFLYNFSGQGEKQIGQITQKIKTAENPDEIRRAYEQRLKTDPTLQLTVVTNRLKDDLGNMGDTINKVAIPALVLLGKNLGDAFDNVGTILGSTGKFLDDFNTSLNQFAKDHPLRPAVDAAGSLKDAAGNLIDRSAGPLAGAAKGVSLGLLGSVLFPPAAPLVSAASLAGGLLSGNKTSSQGGASLQDEHGVVGGVNGHWTYRALPKAGFVRVFVPDTSGPAVPAAPAAPSPPPGFSATHGGFEDRATRVWYPTVQAAQGAAAARAAAAQFSGLAAQTWQASHKAAFQGPMAPPTWTTNSAQTYQDQFNPGRHTLAMQTHFQQVSPEGQANEAARQALAAYHASLDFNKKATDQRRAIQAMLADGTATDAQLEKALDTYSKYLSSSAYAPGSKAQMLATAKKGVRGFEATRTLGIDQTGIDAARIFGDSVRINNGNVAEQNVALQKQWYAATKYIADGLRLHKLPTLQATDLTNQRNDANQVGLNAIAQGQLSLRTGGIDALVARGQANARGVVGAGLSGADQAKIDAAVKAAIAFATANAAKLKLTPDALVTFAAGLHATYDAPAKTATEKALQAAQDQQDAANVFAASVQLHKGTQAQQEAALERQYLAQLSMTKLLLATKQITPQGAANLNATAANNLDTGRGAIDQNTLSQDEAALTRARNEKRPQGVINALIKKIIGFEQTHPSLGRSADEIANDAFALRQGNTPPTPVPGPQLIRPNIPQPAGLDATFGTSITRVTSAGVNVNETVALLRAALAKDDSTIAELRQQVAYLRNASSTLNHIEQNTRPEAKDKVAPARGNPHSGMKRAV